MNLILGSGIIGRIAKHMLGSEWGFVSHGKSRYFSFDPPLAERYVRYNDDSNHIVQSIVGQQTPILYKAPFSYGGQLIYNETNMVLDPYISKVYGEHPACNSLLKTNFTAFDCSRAIYEKLGDMLSADIKSGLGVVNKIDCKNRKVEVLDNDKIKHEYDYDRIVSTIPLDVLYKACDIDHDLECNNIYYYFLHVGSGIDLEGADETYVCDPEIAFFRCIYYRSGKYLFMSNEPIDDPYNYFGAFIGYDFEILDAWVIENALPVGSPPDLRNLESDGIICVGSNAQWDDMVDITRSMLRLQRIRG